MAAPSNPDRDLRRDAELNRRRILAAAREVFRDRGLGATLDDVARHAGVGTGTVYRRFRNKEALVDALFEDMIERIEQATAEALEEEDAWRGLATGLERVCELQALDLGLRQVTLGTGKGPQRQKIVRERVKPAVDALVTRAKEQGSLRADVQPWDLPMIQLMIASVSDHTGHPELWRRYLYLILDGMRAKPAAATPLPLPSFSEPEMFAAIDTASAPEPGHGPE